ncbi:hypothetical protein M0812_29879 [Anaeramoeba flamelloides]|uniref:Uncharacterized protein n=1 Tax=Anaeramoeba flamelloides TaxID=1746091 RepID=A0AAV7Y2X9_9EUKA|nr:hypothetical protein M0812_29879 [Anaeramoeba flamelloides]
MINRWNWVNTNWPSGYTKLGSINYHSLVEYQNMLYVFGGFGFKGSGTNNLWKLSGNNWEIVKCLGKRPPPRFKHKAVVASDLMWVYGGCRSGTKPLNDFYCFNFTNLKWKRVKTKKSPPGRHSHSFVVLDENRIVLHGGIGPDNVPLNDLWLFSIPKKKWIKLEPQDGKLHPMRRHRHTSVVINGEMFVFAGTDGRVRLNNLSKCQFFSTCVKWISLNTFGDIPDPRRDHTAASYKDKM